MTSVLQFGSNEIVVNDPNEVSYLKGLIQQIILEGRTEWIPFLCESEDGTAQTFEFLITPGVPISIVTDAPVEHSAGDRNAMTGSIRRGSSGA